jgi:SAM-dependent methyltransferase
MGLRAFLDGAEKRRNLNLLDVGCGNRSSIFIKKINPKFDIYGIDIGDYNQSSESRSMYFSYLIVNPDVFDESIKNINLDFDIIISNHNIEHCHKPDKTFAAMIERLAPGGYMFVAKPSLNTIKYPSREGTLNFYDDDTHNQPIDLCNLIAPHANNIQCIYYNHSYRPFFWRLVGFANEFRSRLKSKVMLGTWDYYGFEQIAWLQKLEK